MLFFLMGGVMGLMFYFKTEDTYEKALFKALADDVQRSNPNITDSVTTLLNSVSIVHNAIAPRQKVFSQINGFKAGVLQPVTVDLMTGQGACGSYALVLARLMDDLGFDARMAQMKVGDTYGGHNIVEVKVNDNWVVVDPLYNLHFTEPGGRLASFNKVQNNWDYYKAQLPEGYDHAYNYSDVRYTNWDKVPVLMPAFKKILDWTLGKEKADGLSIRIVMMRKFNVFFNITLIIQCLLVLYTVVLLTRKSKADKLRVQKKSSAESTSKGSITIIKTKPVGDPQLFTAK